MPPLTIFKSKIFFLLLGGFPKDDILTNVSDIQDILCFKNMNTFCLKHPIIIDLNYSSLLETDPEFWSQTHFILLLSRCVLEFLSPQLVCLLKYTISGLCSAEYWQPMFGWEEPFISNFCHPITINFFHQRTWKRKFAFSPWSLLLVANVGTQVRTRLVRQVEWIISVLIHLVNLILCGVNNIVVRIDDWYDQKVPGGNIKSSLYPLSIYNCLVYRLCSLSWCLLLPGQLWIVFLLWRCKLIFFKI